MVKLPFIIILDLDLTLIGNGKPISTFMNIMNFIKNYCKHKKFAGDICKIPNKNIDSLISSQYLRPNLKEGLSEIKKLFPEVEFFIFSNGTYNYVNKNLKYIEKQTGIKFNKLILTRELNVLNSNLQYEKDINDYIKDRIINALTSKYKKELLNKNKDFIFANRLLIIDDVANYWNNHPNLIVCKPYEYYPIIELDTEILNIIYGNPELLNYISNMEFGDTLPNIKIKNKSFDEIKINYHLDMANIYRQHLESNKDTITKEGNLFMKIANALKLQKGKNAIITPKFCEKLTESLLSK